MTTTPEHLTAAGAQLAPYAHRAVARAHAFALSMHADELTVEHFFSALLFDEESAAAQAVVHGFADPQTLAVELMAMSPGITVVGAERCVPFSVRGVAALRAAQAAADPVYPRHLFCAALAELDAGAHEALAGAASSLPELDASGGGSEGPIFQRFTTSAKRAASRAGHEALSRDRRAISPAHMVIGALDVDEELGAEVGLSASRARGRLSGRDEDPTLPAPRALPPTDALTAFLGSAPDGANTLDLLEHLLERGREELVQLFVRQRVTPDAMRRARGFRDPEADS